MANTAATFVDTVAMLAQERKAVLGDGTEQPTALCLSGGGVRSAAFCLGVVQALAAGQKLRGFHYLSTVSGGGYIGGWLQALIRTRGGIIPAEQALAGDSPDELKRLRNYTSFLTPNAGLFSTDTWAAGVLFARNLILIWAGLLPVLAGLALLPVLHRTLSWLQSGGAWLYWSFFLLSLALLLTGTIEACRRLPSHRLPPAGDLPVYAEPPQLQRGIVWPAVAWGLVLPFAIGHWQGQPVAGAFGIALPYAAILMLGYFVAWVAQTRAEDPEATLFARNFWPWVGASLASSLLLGIVCRIVLAWPEESLAQVVTIGAPLGIALVHSLHATVFVGLRRESRFADLDREWLARVNADILRPLVLWTALSAATLLLGQWLLELAIHPLRDMLPGLLTGPVAALLGKQAFVRGADALHDPGWRDRVMTWGLNLLALIFAVLLFGMLGAGLQKGLGEVQQALLPCPGFVSPTDVAVVPAPVGPGCSKLPQPTGSAYDLLPVLLQLGLGLMLGGWYMGVRGINVNRFSMHGTYRNRIARAFLGTARDPAGRHADPYTGFAERDNLPLATIRQDEQGQPIRHPADPPGWRLFPVINATLNLTEPANAGWAERKGASFTATPLHCGSSALRQAGAFVPTAQYAGFDSRYASRSPRRLRNPDRGLRLGGILTVSGAAVSPNQGYHSAPMTAFLLTLFNVRLGAWLPNPAKAGPEDLCVAKPRDSQWALIQELRGVSTGDRGSIYLSDGGHFDNLGVYEMLRRRCGLIVVVDAGQDGNCAMFDLGTVIRRAEIDLGVQVTMDLPIPVHPRKRLEDPSPPALALGHATGRIRYPGGATGKLVYIKPSYLAEIPAQVRSYGTGAPTFPHESTLDQWFTESQFDSYRTLGRWQAERVLAANQL